MGWSRRWTQRAAPGAPEAVAAAPDRWRVRWSQQLEWLGLPPVFLGVGERLLSCYHQPGRHFHDASRVLGCLRELDRYPGSIRSPDEIELAVWFHAAVWDPAASAAQNQLASARWFQREFGDLAAHLIDTGLVRSLIGAVGGGACQPDGDHSLARDVGSGWLAADPVRYEVNCGAIRQDLAIADDLAWARFRGDTVRKLLEKDWVFGTRHYRQTCEKQARENLLKEFERLGNPG